MIIKGISLEQARHAANVVGVQLKQDSVDNGKNIRTGIVPIKGGNFRKYSALGFHSNRKTNAVCWHGHKEWMEELFRINPDAMIHSAFAKYNGAKDFQEKFPATYFTEVGLQMFPRYYGDLCDCFKGVSL